MSDDALPAEVRETIDVVAVQRLQSAYADAVTCRDWARVAALFTDDADVVVDTVTAPPRRFRGGSEVASFIAAAVERFEFFEFVILNSHIDLGDEPDHASARIFMCELRVDATSGRRTTAYGLYRDTYVRGTDGWRFATRRYQSLARDGRHEVFAFPPEVGPEPS